MSTNPRVVFAHDWIRSMRGGEQCLDLLAQTYPDAPILTLLHKRDEASAAINAHPIKTSFLQSIPGIFDSYRWFLPLFPLATATLKVPPCDVLVSLSHCAIKAVTPPRGAKHICYCFTPMRYAWSLYEDYFGRNPLKAVVFKPILAGLRRWDRRTADRVDLFIGISKHVQERIKSFYGRDSELVYPPVKTDFYTPGPDGHDGYDLIVSALVPYKKVDLAVRAYSRLGYPLKVVGTGTEYDALRRSACANVEFLGWQSNESVRKYFRRCRMVVFPGEEDFGIVPVEANACGKPVIAYARGGACETVADGVSGRLFSEQTEASLLAAIEAGAATAWNQATIRAQAEQFAAHHFVEKMSALISTMAAR